MGPLTRPFYGTRAGPGWHQTGASVPRVRNLPFSLLRMLIRVNRKPPREGNAEGGGGKAEMGGENQKASDSYPKAPPMRHQSHIRAPTRPVARHLIHTLKLHQGSHKARGRTTDYRPPDRESTGERLKAVHPPQCCYGGREG
jgi:hypothetical protein